jgi:hypothetical protein
MNPWNVLAPRLVSDMDEKLILIQLSYMALLCYFNLFMGNSFQYIPSKKHLIPNMSLVCLRYIYIYTHIYIYVCVCVDYTTFTTRCHIRVNIKGRKIKPVAYKVFCIYLVKLVAWFYCVIYPKYTENLRWRRQRERKLEAEKGRCLMHARECTHAEFRQSSVHEMHWTSSSGYNTKFVSTMPTSTPSWPELRRPYETPCCSWETVQRIR